MIALAYSFILIHYLFLLHKNRKVKIRMICILTVLFETGAQHLIVSKEKKLYDVFQVYSYSVCVENLTQGARRRAVEERKGHAQLTSQLERNSTVVT